MQIIQSILLGIIQGLTEFIPISSTAHLTIAGNLMGMIDQAHPERWTSFIAVIQLGTLVSVLVYFRNDILRTISAFFKENLGAGKRKLTEQSQDSKMGWYVIFGTLPIVTIGMVAKKLIEGDFTKSMNVIGFTLIALALVLLYAEKVAKKTKDINNVTFKDSILVGLAQCLALIPGASRSGTTITAGLFLGMNRETAARFSFLLSIPAVLASGLLQFYQSIEYINSGDLMMMAVATVVSGISGYMAIAFLLKFLRTKSTMLFIVYRIIAGAIVVWLAYSGIITTVID